MLPDRPQRPLSVEALLRAKREERPGAEYWARFDRELELRMRQALLRSRPRRDRWSRLWRTALVALSGGFAVAGGLGAFILLSSGVPVMLATPPSAPAALPTVAARGQATDTVAEVTTPTLGSATSATRGEASARRSGSALEALVNFSKVEAQFVVDTLPTVLPQVRAPHFSRLMTPDTLLATYHSPAHYVADALESGTARAAGSVGPLTQF